MAGPSKKKVTKKAPAKKAPAKKAPAKKTSAPAKKPSMTTKKVAATAEGQPMARQLENVTADLHYAVMTRGRGDCMYHAISDQLYGHQDAHAEIRATTAAFLRQHRALYRPFVPADLGAENRHSTRLTRGGALAELPPPPTEEELDQAFEAYVERYVAKPGKWGGDLELQALAGAFLVDIVVYQDNLVSWRQEPMDGVLPAGHRPEDRKLLRVAYYGGVHYASVRPLPAAAAAPDPASPKRKRTPDRDPEEDEEDEARPRKKRAVAASPSPSPSPSSPPPPVLQRQEPPPPERAAPPAPSTSRPPSTWRSASCPPSKGKAMARATAKPRPATRHTTPATTIITIPPAPALAPAARAVPAVLAAAAAAAAAAADTSPAVPARAPDDDDDDDKCRLVHVRLAGIPGGEISISGMVRGHLTFTRAGEVLAAYAVEEEEG
ncbi:MAG: hypothetical protein M1826_002119 [Phylliscum demangeonii]|nr:MAG: hypothetical protein M1826_002119 [Phylliscum demangeonii]